MSKIFYNITRITSSAILCVWIKTQKGEEPAGTLSNFSTNQYGNSHPWLRNSLKMMIADVKARRNFPPRKLSKCRDSQKPIWMQRLEHMLNNFPQVELSDGAAHSFTFLSVLDVAKTTNCLFSGKSSRIHTLVNASLCMHWFFSKRT